MNRPSDQLIHFCNLLAASNELQARVKQATAAIEIVAIAESIGCEISCKELRFWSKELRATYFPWSEMGNEWRRDFFI